MQSLPVTAVIINFQTPDLLTRAVISLRQFYPRLQLLLIDNGSGDESPRLIKDLRRNVPDCTDIVLNDRNTHHGPAMDQSVQYAKSPFVLFIDSDCEVKRGGFVELMLDSLMQRPDAYAVGKKIFMDRRGFDTIPSEKSIPYIRPICMLIKRELYLTLSPFAKHGTPCLANMRSASERGFFLVDFPIEDYVSHQGRGTADRYGYNLGWRGRLNYLLHKVGL